MKSLFSKLLLSFKKDALDREKIQLVIAAMNDLCDLFSLNKDDVYIEITQHRNTDYFERIYHSKEYGKELFDVFFETGVLNTHKVNWYVTGTEKSEVLKEILERTT